MHGEGLVSHHRKPETCLVVAEHLHLFSFFSSDIYIWSCESNLDITSRTMSVCLRDSLTSPIKQNHPVMFTVLLSAEEIRIRSTFIYIAVGIAAHSSLMAFFYGHMGDRPRRIPHKHTVSISPPCRYLFSRSPNERNRPALSEMHYSRAYRRALQCIMFNFYSEQCCDMGPFSQKKRSHLFIRRMQYETIQSTR